MPTAYTAILGETEDMKLKDFAMLCARNFGALAMMRDLPLSEPIPEKFEIPPYYKDNLVKAQKKHADFMAMTESGRAEYLERTYNEMVEGYRKEQEESSKQKDILRQRYNAMLLKVVNWTPPTSEHESLREFMIKQIHDSIEWDCSEYTPLIPDKAEWCDIGRYKIMMENEIALFQKTYYKALESTASRNKWLSDLRESLRDCD